MSPLGPSVAALPLGAADMDAGRLDALRRGGVKGADGQRAAAEELQVVFLTQLLREMRRTVPQSDFLPPSPARSVYEGAFDRAVAGSMAKDDPLGLVRLLGQHPGLKLENVPADTKTGQQQKGGSRP